MSTDPFAVALQNLNGSKTVQKMLPPTVPQSGAFPAASPKPTAKAESRAITNRPSVHADALTKIRQELNDLQARLNSGRGSDSDWHRKRELLRDLAAVEHPKSVSRSVMTRVWLPKPQEANGNER